MIYYTGADREKETIPLERVRRLYTDIPSFHRFFSDRKLP